MPSKNLKVAVIGGGSTYTPELVEGFISHQGELPLGEFVLMDIDPRRLEVVGGLAHRMFQSAQLTTKITLTQDLSEALDAADYVITQVRVGGMAMRVVDERIPLEFGVVGQETTGPGGFASALRNIPAVLEVARAMERLAPQALLINFTNPSGLITEAVATHSKTNVIGLCNVPPVMQRDLAGRLGIPGESLTLDYLGLNHLSWVRGAKADGEDVWSELLHGAIAEARAKPYPFTPELLEDLELIPNYYLRYYYHQDQVLAEQRQAPRTRAEEVQETERMLLQLYADPEVRHKPPLLEKRGGALYSTAAVGLISALHNDAKRTLTVNVPNRGALPDLPPHSVVEVPSVVGRTGAHPLPLSPAPSRVRGLIQAVKAYEELTVQTAMTGNPRLAVQALLAHPLVPSHDVARKLWKALEKANRPYFPRGRP